jgi:hypothetical protein
LMYLSWLIKILSFVCLIFNPRKKFNSPIILILNPSYMHFANSLQIDALVTLNILSSIYICTINMSLPFLFMKRVVSILPMLKPFSIRKVFNLSYHALGVCFKPYKTF